MYLIAQFSGVYSVAPGRKTGGRQKGVPHKRTVINQMVAEALASKDGQGLIANALARLAQPPSGAKKALDMLRELSVLSTSLVALHQPKKQEDGSVVLENHEKLHAYLGLAIRATAELASFESPKFKAVAMTEVPPVPVGTPANDAKLVEGIRKGTQQEAAAVYMRMVRAGQGK